MRCNAEQKLTQIVHVLYKKSIEDISGESDGRMGLLSGKAGVLLFWAYYSKYTGSNRYAGIFEDYQEWYLEKICAEYNRQFSFCNGLAGILYTLHHLSENGFIDIDIIDAEKYFDVDLKCKLDIHLKYGNLDFLHGCIGVGFYYLKRKDAFAISCLNRIVDGLRSSAIIEGEKIKWFFDFNNGKRGVNICLSHGMSSVVLFLCDVVYIEGIGYENVKNMIQGAINYILSQKLVSRQYGCFYPGMSLECAGDITRSRLGWCYGDLGVAIALFQAAKILNNKNLNEHAMDIFRYTAMRRDLLYNLVVDAGVCHGTSGIAHIFGWLYRETGEIIFRETNSYWIQEMLGMDRFKNGLAGYKCSRSHLTESWENDYYLLDGITGIGLVLLSYLSEEWLDWSEVLLLSNTDK